jgi:hypothetical protein
MTNKNNENPKNIQSENHFVDEDFSKLFEEYEKDTQQLVEGGVVKGVVVGISDKGVAVDIGAKSVGFIDIMEFKRDGEIEEGDVVDVFLERLENKKGELIISRDNARRFNNWHFLKNCLEDKTIIEGKIIGRVGIEKRPKEAATREVFGHFEVDTIIGKDHKGAIITLNERASGMLWMRKVESKDAELVKEKLAEILEEIRPYLKSITSDNGKEFAGHQFITDEYCDFYFANPYSPWERGSNENLNGLIRQYIPKKSDFNEFTDLQIKEIENKINCRPRKRYGYENPIFVMEKLLFNPKVAFVA